MSNEIVKYRVREVDSKEFLPNNTVHVIRPITYVKDCKIPIYENGVLLSDTILAELGLEKVGFTQEQLDRELFTSYYELNPNLADRVRQYAALLSRYGLEPTATSDEITAAIMADETATPEEKAAVSGSLLALIHDIELNFNEVAGNGLDAWNVLDKLIKYLPEAGPPSGAVQSQPVVPVEE